MADPQPTRFAVRMRQRREELKLKGAPTARRAGVSQQRLAQVERGYETRGAVKIPAKPSAEFIAKVATALDMDLEESLALDGYTINDVPAGAVSTVPEGHSIWANWARLTPQQQACVNWMVDLMLDPHTAFRGGTGTTSGNRPVFVPPAESRSRT